MQQDLRYILIIAREKNISRAAEKIHITQPALSLYLARLEKQLGTTLFDRDGMKLTFAGKKYIKMAIQIEHLYRKFQLDLCSINQQQACDFKIGTSPHIGSNILPYVLPEFIRKYPKIEISITEGRTDELEKKLQKNEIDLALIHLPLTVQGLSYNTIGEARYVVAVSATSSLLSATYTIQDAQYRYIAPESLEEQKFIMAFPHQGVRRIADRILEKVQITPKIAFMTSSVETALLSAGAGLGIALLPEDYIRLFNCGDLKPEYLYLEDRYAPFWQFVIAYAKPTSELTMPEIDFIQLAKKAFEHCMDSSKHDDS